MKKPFLNKFLVASIATVFFMIGFQVQSLAIENPKNPPSAEAHIDSLFSEWDTIGKPGATVAVVKNGKIEYSNAYGSATLEYAIPNTPSTIFHIASISKQFTVFAIMLLEEKGKLSLDDDIRTHIQEVPDFGHTITLRHLASHTSGLRDQWNLLTMAGWRIDDVITKDHVLNLVKRQNELNFEPGEEYLYSNTGFTLLAEIVSRVSGQSFAEFTKENIFKPLNMSNTLFYDDHEKIVKNRAYSYYSDNDVYKKRVLSYANAGATSLFTTVEDLALWALNFEDVKVGSQEIIETMNTKATLNDGETFGGALGQFVDTTRGLKQIQHGGADAGYRTFFGRFPEQDFAVMVFSNYAAFNPREKASKIADLYLEEYYTEDQPTPLNEKYEKTSLSANQLKKFTGHYWNDEQVSSIKIDLKDDTLRYYINENRKTPLMPVTGNAFIVTIRDECRKVEFKDTADTKTMIVSDKHEESTAYKYYEPAEYSEDQLREFSGTYYSEELQTFYDFELVDGKLTAKHLRTGEVELTPVKDDLFKGNRWHFRKIKFVRKDNNIDGIKVSSGRVRDLLFEKQ